MFGIIELLTSFFTFTTLSLRSIHSSHHHFHPSNSSPRPPNPDEGNYRFPNQRTKATRPFTNHDTSFKSAKEANNEENEIVGPSDRFFAHSIWTTFPCLAVACLYILPLPHCCSCSHKKHPPNPTHPTWGAASSQTTTQTAKTLVKQRILKDIYPEMAIVWRTMNRLCSPNRPAQFSHRNHQNLLHCIAQVSEHNHCRLQQR